jgi:tRNA threonylcarbamoyladenosine biosynthesis protein TsaB
MWLALDSATDRASVALGDSVGDAIEESLSGARRHAASLLPMIEALLRRRGVGLHDLDGIALSDGPGSFTGLRVGAAVAKAMVHARDMPLWIAPSLMLRAAGVGREGEPVLSVANALRGELYAAVYRCFPDRVETLLPAGVFVPEALLSLPLRPALVVGEAPADIGTKLEQWSGRCMVKPPEGSPQARRLIALVGVPGGATAVVSRSWEPVYGRPAEAQARWEMAHGRSLPDSIGSPR